MLRFITPICVASTLLSEISETLLNTHIKAEFEPSGISFYAKSTKADCRTPETKRTINEYAKQTFNNNNEEINGPSV